MDIKIKAEHAKQVIAFNGGGNTPLGERKDLDKLALIALQSKDKLLLSFFEGELPSIEELQSKTGPAPAPKKGQAISKSGDNKGAQSGATAGVPINPLPFS